ncbi:MAG: DUF1223 domain-containing protein [Acidobacteria bacterium]|nr:DUF1223 domain-containing protein [Acidobacteriota bacterium]
MGPRSIPMKLLIAAFLLTALPLAAGAGDAPVSVTERVPVIVELFTSEGCSSCPPADAYLRELHANQPVDGVEVLALSEHVDYWNRLGWKDPFSDADFSKRQSWYSTHWPTRVYTPQMVVDGVHEAVGTDPAAIAAVVREAGRRPKGRVRIASALNESGVGLRIEAHGLPASAGAIVRVAIVEDGLESQVPHGENKGMTLRHDGVVRRLAEAGATGSRAKTFEGGASLELDPSWNRDRLRAVVFVQEPGTRRILAAGHAPLTAAE